MIPLGCIITNPPYKLAQELVLRARELPPKVVMLLRLAFLESERRRHILESGDLARVYVFRLPVMHRHGWTGPRAPSATAYAWFVWDRVRSGSTVLHRISWMPAPANDQGPARSRRLALTPPALSAAPQASFAWLVWEREFRAPQPTSNLLETDNGRAGAARLYPASNAEGSI